MTNTPREEIELLARQVDIAEHSIFTEQQVASMFQMICAELVALRVAGDQLREENADLRMNIELLRRNRAGLRRVAHIWARLRRSRSTTAVNSRVSSAGCGVKRLVDFGDLGGRLDAEILGFDGDKVRVQTANGGPVLVPRWPGCPAATPDTRRRR